MCGVSTEKHNFNHNQPPGIAALSRAVLILGGIKMSIEQRGEWKYVLVCDECGREVKYFNTFDEAVEYKRENGWKSKKDDGEWITICPDCQ